MEFLFLGLHRCQFDLYKEMRIIPAHIDSLSDDKNLIALCGSYHLGIDHQTSMKKPLLEIFMLCEKWKPGKKVTIV